MVILNIKNIQKYKLIIIQNQNLLSKFKEKNQSTLQQITLMIRHSYKRIANLIHKVYLTNNNNIKNNKFYIVSSKAKTSNLKKPYQKLLFTPLKAEIKIQNKQQKENMRPKFVLDNCKNLNNQLNTLQIIHLATMIKDQFQVYQSIGLVLIETIIQYIKKGQSIVDFSLVDLQPFQLKDMIQLINYTISASIMKYDDITALYLINIINLWKNYSQLPQSQKKSKLKFQDIEIIFQFLAKKGYFSQQMLLMYIKSIKNNPIPSQFLTSKDQIYYFNLIKKRVSSLYYIQKNFFQKKSINQSKNNQQQNQQISKQQKSENKLQQNIIQKDNISQQFNQIIGKQFYQKLVEQYLSFFKYDQIFYSYQSTIPSIQGRLILTNFLYRQIIQKVKSTYSSTIMRIFNYQLGNLAVLPQQQLCIEIFQILSEMYSPINSEDKKLVHQILKRYQTLYILKNKQIPSLNFLPFGLSHFYHYQSEFLLHQLSQMIKSEVIIKKQHLNQYIYHNFSKSLQILKYLGIYLQQKILIRRKNNKLQSIKMGKSLSQFNQYSIFDDKSQVQFFLIIINQIFDNINTEKGFVQFKKVIGQFSQGVDGYQKSIISQNIKSKKKLKYQKTKILKEIIQNFKMFQVLYMGSPFVINSQNTKQSLWRINIIFNMSLPAVKFCYLTKIFISYIQLFQSDLQKNQIFKKIVKNSDQICKIIKAFICYPQLLKNLVEIYANIENQEQEFQYSQKQNQLFRFLDNARKNFSQQYKLISTQDSNTLDKYNKYPNFYNPLTCQFNVTQYKYDQVYLESYFLSKENIRKNLINDIYGQILKDQSSFKKQLQKQLLKIEGNKKERIRIQKNYLQYPYFTDFFIRKGTKIYALMIQNDEKKIFLDNLYQISSKYFQNQKFNVIKVKKIQDIKAIFE